MKVIVATYYNEADKKLGILITHGKAFGNLKLDEKRLLSQAKLELSSARKAKLADFDAKSAEIEVKDFKYADDKPLDFKAEEKSFLEALETYLKELDNLIKDILQNIQKKYSDVRTVVYDGDVNLTFPSKTIFPNFLLNNTILDIFKDSTVTVNAYSSASDVVDAARELFEKKGVEITVYNNSNKLYEVPIRTTQSFGGCEVSLEEKMDQLSIARTHSGDNLFFSRGSKADSKAEIQGKSNLTPNG
ncbi:hypothetical protein ACNVED_04200 [Legionella sp. D16C41]|uniref:hypothetical protein n=1 Tax=Legionella sp. D16C41 TaxID=3402688 RepID=UPI003AF9CEE9